MNIHTKTMHVFWAALGVLLIHSGCANTQAVFSEQAYQQAISLKVESLELMDKATATYSDFEDEVTALHTKLQIAHQYAQGRPNNETTTRQWQIMIDPERNLLGGFLNRWKQKGPIQQAFINENKKIIADAFDTIIALESGKIKPSDVN